MKLPLRTKANYAEQAVYLLDANELRLAQAAYGSSGEDALARIAEKANSSKQSTSDVQAAVARAGCSWEPLDSLPAAPQMIAE